MFCDDLTFESNDHGYKALKTTLDGSFNGYAENVLIYATSNRRHLLPEYDTDNEGFTVPRSGELHPSETVEEKIALSERFGLWVSFYPFSQDEYLAIVDQWLNFFGIDMQSVPMARAESLVWSLERGSRSGRVAYQFARDFAGRR